MLKLLAYFLPVRLTGSPRVWLTIAVSRCSAHANIQQALDILITVVIFVPVFQVESSRTAYEQAAIL